LSCFHGGPLLAGLLASINEAVKGLVLLLERFGMPSNCLSGAVQFFYGVSDLLATQDTSFSEV
jgi:hypothetical protein